MRHARYESLSPLSLDLPNRSQVCVAPQKGSFGIFNITAPMNAPRKHDISICKKKKIKTLNPADMRRKSLSDGRARSTGEHD